MLNNFASIKLSMTDATLSRIIACIPKGATFACHFFGAHGLQRTPDGVTIRQPRHNGFEQLEQDRLDSVQLCLFVEFIFDSNHYFCILTQNRTCDQAVPNRVDFESLQHRSTADSLREKDLRRDTESAIAFA